MEGVDICAQCHVSVSRCFVCTWLRVVHSVTLGRTFAGCYCKENTKKILCREDRSVVLKKRGSPEIYCNKNIG